MKGCGLEPAEAPVRADLLLERRDLTHARVVLADEEQVWRVDHAVFVLQAHDRMRAEERRRVLTFDAILFEISDTIGPEDDRAARR